MQKTIFLKKNVTKIWTCYGFIMLVHVHDLSVFFPFLRNEKKIQLKKPNLLLHFLYGRIVFFFEHPEYKVLLIQYIPNME